MIHEDTLEARIAEHYAGLSGQLQRAADYVQAHPLDIVSRSLRAIASESRVSPATFSRLARALGYDSFDGMKDVARRSVESASFSEKAEKLRIEHEGDATMLMRQGDACLRNIETLVAKTDIQRLEDVATLMRTAPRVVLFGALGSTGIVEYMAYLARYFAPGWSLAGRMGASLAADLALLGEGDVLFIVTKTPYVARAVSAAAHARSLGAEVVVVTDAHKCPALAHATQSFIVPSDSPQFFSSYATTLVLLESLIAMIVSASGSETTALIREVEATNQALGEYWTG